MKQFRWVIILAVTAAALFAVFLILDARSDKEKEKNKKNEPKQLLSIDADAITRITIDNEEGHFAFDWDNSVGWKLVSSEQFRINQYAINSICTYICNVESVKTVAEDCENTAAYGFDNPITIKVFTTDTDADHPYILYVGDCNPTNDAYYVMVDGSDDVYTIGYTAGSIFSTAKNTLKNDHIFDYYASQMQYFRLERGGEVITEIRRGTDENFALITPAGYASSKVNIDDLMNTVIRVTMKSLLEEHPQQQDFAKYGLDQPHTKIFLEAKENGIMQKEEVWFGSKVTDSENATLMYGYLKSIDQIFTVLVADVPFISEDAKHYMLPYCADVGLEELRGLEIDMGDVYDLHSVLSIDYANGVYALDGQKIVTAENEELFNLFFSYFRSISYLRFDDTDFDAKPEGEPAMKITYDYLSGEKLELGFIEKETNVFYLMKNGKYTGQTVRLNAFTGNGGVIKAYDSLTAAMKKQ